MNTYTGMRVFVSRPTTSVRRRTWWQRLTETPWRPFVIQEVQIHAAAVPTDKCYRVDNDLHCGEQFYEKLKAQVGE